MIVTKPGIYKDVNGTELRVMDCASKDGGAPYFRAYWKGGYYNVNKEPENAPFDEIEWEVVEFIRDLE